MWKLRVITLVSLLLAVVAVGCTSSSLTDIETLATSDISVEDAAEATVKAMETQESLYATSTAVAQDNAVEATVKAKEIQEAVDATLEAKQAGGTPTARSGSAPPVVTTGPTSTVSAVISTAPTSTVSAVIPTPTVVITPTVGITPTVVVTPMVLPTIVPATVTPTPAVTSTVTPTVTPTPTPVPAPTPAPSPVPTPINYRIIEGSTPIGTSGFNYQLQGYFVEDFDAIADSVMTQVKWGEGGGYEEVSVMQSSGEIIASHTYTSAGSFTGDIRLVVNGETVANMPFSVTMNIGSIPTAVLTPGGVIGVGPTSTVTPTATAAPTPTPAAVFNKIVFTDGSPGFTNIYIVDADGSNRTRLTTCCDVAEDWPEFSPDGKLIAFWSTKGDDGGPSSQEPNRIWVMHSDGSNHRVLKNGTPDKKYPSWHPDGSKLIASGIEAVGDIYEIWNIHLDGSEPTSLEAEGLDPDWHPDGTQFIVGTTSVFNGLKINYLDGSGPTNLGAEGAEPKWSPDGTKIAFVRFPDIWVMNSDGSNATDVTGSNCSNATSCRSPSWSPDGTRIVFQRTNGIHITNSDGTNMIQISTSGMNPHWGPAAP